MAARTFVWLGGAMFVAALGTCIVWYLFVLGHSQLFRGADAVAADVALFTLFALHHSVFAREAVKRWFASLTPQMIRSVYVYVASALLMVVCAAWRPIGGELYATAGPAAVVLGGLQLVGVWLTWRAVARIDPLELAGIRPAARHDALQTDGVYRWVRHPIYLGWTFAVFGTPHMTGDRLTFAVVSTAYLMAAVPFEEQSLRQAFGDEYERYAQTVRWRIIPFIY